MVAADGERVCVEFELCSDLIDSGVCDFIEWLSLPRPRRLADGGV